MRWRTTVNEGGDPIEGYEISDTGQVRSYWTFGPNSRVGDHARDKKARLDKRGCWEVHLRISNDYALPFQVHRLVALAFLGQPPSAGDVVIHVNHEQTDNRVANLAWVSKERAFAHSAEVVDRYTGAQGGAPKLSRSAIEEIRDSDLSQAELAKKFGVDIRTVYCAQTGRSWKKRDARRKDKAQCQPRGKP